MGQQYQFGIFCVIQRFLQQTVVHLYSQHWNLLALVD